METTNDGFTFKRVSSNRAERSNTKYTHTVPSKMGGKFNNFEFGEFIFRKLPHTKPMEIVTRKKTPKFNQGKETEFYLPENAISDETKEEEVKPSKRGKANFKKDLQSKIVENNKRTGNFIYKTLKKRKTIRLADSLDLSTDSDRDSSLQNNGAGQMENETIRMEPTKGQYNGAGQMENETIRMEPTKGQYNDAGQAENETIRMDFPVQKERIKSYDIHTKVNDGNINELVKKCVIFLNDESLYAQEIIKHSDAQYFSDINYKREIENVTNKFEDTKGEVEKWKKVYNEMKENNRIEMNRIEEPEVVEYAPFDKNAMIQEFESKVLRLKTLEGKLRYFFENAKNKSENLLKNIFGAAEDRNVDALFLLKAMSKLGR